MEFQSYQSKASMVYERAMENVSNQIDTAIDELEDLAVLIGEVEDDELQIKLDELLSKAMRSLDQI